MAEEFLFLFRFQFTLQLNTMSASTSPLLKVRRVVSQSDQFAQRDVLADSPVADLSSGEPVQLDSASKEVGGSARSSVALIDDSTRSLDHGLHNSSQSSTQPGSGPVSDVIECIDLISDSSEPSDWTTGSESDHGIRAFGFASSSESSSSHKNSDDH
jgi:hypothetical protein